MREAIGAYKLLERTGSDALGDIYRARDTERGRTASVRLVHPAIAFDPAKRKNLIADAHKASALSHPSLAALFDVIDEGDDLALAHEHVEGKSLAATLGGTALNPKLASAIGIQIADGLAELHASDLEHGAVDSEHIVITPRGQAKLLDAGLIAWLQSETAAAGAAKKDDIAALGSVLTAMTGSSLPKATWADDLRLAIARTKPGHARRYEAIATLAAELRAVAAMLEARAEAAPPAPANSRAWIWLVVALLLLAAGAWFLM